MSLTEHDQCELAQLERENRWLKRYLSETLHQLHALERMLATSHPETRHVA